MEKNSNTLFGKANLQLMAVGAVIMVVGLFLLSGGKSNDPNVFNDNEVYSTTRITIAPLLIILGLIIEVVAIMKKDKSN
jgi:hypothetical protein